jgi:predicted O-methyltransferase YrrM
VDDKFERYVTELFATEDPILSKIRARHAAENLPPINVSPEEGKLLHVLLHAIQAKRVLEIGSLGGYSGVWLARALPPGGELTTIEKDPKHARIAREAFDMARLHGRVQVIEGSALDILPTLARGFDAVFIDADKEPLPQYFDWGMRLLRRGGLLLCDNAFFHGAAVDPSDRSANAVGVRAFNELAARDPRLVATIIPVRDGLVVGVKTRDTA